MSPHPPKPIATLANRGIQPRFGPLAQDCRQLAMNRLAEHLSGVFGQVDDTLFECAEHAGSNQLQTLFFDSMRDIRKLRPQIERTYHQRIAKNLADFLEGKLTPPDTALEPDLEHLSLVENEDYEESLLITNMVSRVKARCTQQLFALDQRIALLNSGRKLNEDANPFGPQMIALAFREALAGSLLPLRIKTVLYTLFDQHVMNGLDNLYENLNRRLIEGGVLPNLKYTAKRAGGSPPTAPGPNQPAAHSGHVTPAAAATPPLNLDGPPPTEPVALYSGLAALLGEQRQRHPDTPLFGDTRSIASFTPQKAQHTYSVHEVLDALNRLQRQSAHELAQRLQRPQRVSNLKEDLYRQLEAGSAMPGQQKLPEQEADVIDLVGMLFDFILDDQNLPDSCKTAISHLHTPYLKVALHDQALFTHHQHPARRLLNAMAQAGALHAGGDDEPGLLAKMQWIVEQVIHNFAGDLQLFDSLLEDFSEYTATLRHKVELRERRAVETVKGHDKLFAARQQAQAIIGQALHGRTPPVLIRNFLEQTWADVLVFVLLRHGQGSAEWQRASAAAEHLAWSGTPLDAAGRERLQELRVGLLDELYKGLELLGGYAEEVKRRLLQDLVACQHAVQGHQPKLADRLSAPLPESPLGAMLGEDAIPLTEAPQQSGLSPRAQELARQLETLEFGTWFEFGNGEDKRTLKLSWFSPTTHNYMFVDHSGQRVAIKPLSLLACEMEQGLARLLPAEHHEPLVDRALHAIYRALQRLSGHSPAAH